MATAFLESIATTFSHRLWTADRQEFGGCGRVEVDGRIGNSIGENGVVCLSRPNALPGGAFFYRAGTGDAVCGGGLAGLRDHAAAFGFGLGGAGAVFARSFFLFGSRTRG